MVKSENLPMVLLVPFLPMVTRKPLTFSAANGTIGTNGTIGRSHGGIFIILINIPHLFFVFLIYFMYVVLFITFTFACMTKILLIYEIHDTFLGSPY